MTFTRFSEIAPHTVEVCATVSQTSRASDAVRDILSRVERMEQTRRPDGYTEGQWHVLLKDMRTFATDWLETALSCGWSMSDLFGCYPDLRAHRWGLAGLVLMIDGREVESISADRILIANRLGTPNAFYRQSPGCSGVTDRSSCAMIWAAVLAQEVDAV